MKKLSILLILILFTSCQIRTPKKPWVVVQKSLASQHDTIYPDSLWLYRLISANGKTIEAIEIYNKYNIGDSIK